MTAPFEPESNALPDYERVEAAARSVTNERHHMKKIVRYAVAWLLVGLVAGLINLVVLVEVPPPPQERAAQYAVTLGAHALGGPVSLVAVGWQVVRR